MTDNKQNIISSIVEVLLKNKYPAEVELKSERFLIDEKDSEEKTIALYDYWNSIESGSITMKDYSLLAKVKQRIGFRVSILHNKIAFRFAAALLIPAMLIVGGYVYINIDRRETAPENFAEIKVRNIVERVPAGETKKVTLPDGSEVWINAGSVLTYPERMDAEERVVELIGESYFSVAKDSQRPFVVRTKAIDVRVLGTKFDVNAYNENGSTVVTLDEGSVEVKAKDGESHKLDAGMQLILDNRTNAVELNNLDSLKLSSGSAWKSGKLVCDRMSMTEIMKALERKYNISIEIEKSVKFKSKYYSVEFINTDSISEIMTLLKDLDGGFNFKIDNNNIKVW